MYRIIFTWQLHVLSYLTLDKGVGQKKKRGGGLHRGHFPLSNFCKRRAQVGLCLIYLYLSHLFIFTCFQPSKTSGSDFCFEKLQENVHISTKLEVVACVIYERKIYPYASYKKFYLV